MNEMYKIIGILVFVIVIFLITVQPWKTTKSNVVEVKGQKIDVELADTPAKRAKGLMYRSSMEKNEGMLFIFPTVDRHAFWMANTYLPLDMIWIDENKTIVHIERRVPSCTETGKLQSLCKSYAPDTPAKYVLEVNAGYTEEFNINLGDKVTF